MKIATSSFDWASQQAARSVGGPGHDFASLAYMAALWPAARRNMPIFAFDRPMASYVSRMELERLGDVIFVSLSNADPAAANYHALVQMKSLWEQEPPRIDPEEPDQIVDETWLTALRGYSSVESADLAAWYASLDGEE